MVTHPPKSRDSDKLISVRQFCDRFGLSRATFYRLVKRGDIQALKIGSSTRIRESFADAWADSLPVVITFGAAAKAASSGGQNV